LPLASFPLSNGYGRFISRSGVGCLACRCSCQTRHRESRWRFCRKKHGCRQIVDWQPHPVNSTSPVELRGRLYQLPRGCSVELDCIERCSSSSTEARQSNPELLSASSSNSSLQSNPDVLSDEFEQGRCGHPLAEVVKAVMPKAGENPAQGTRTLVVRLTWLAWGAFSLATGETGLYQSGDRRQIRRP
jgi:hypothetical protein